MLSRGNQNCKSFELFPHELGLSSRVTALIWKKNIKLSFNIYDNQNKGQPCFLFLHGMGFSHKIFRPQFDFFTQYRIIAIDLIGHGDSVKIDGIEGLSDAQKTILAEELYSWPCVIKQTQLLLERLRVDRTHAFGWSLGGHILYALAVGNPNLLKSIITTGTPPINFSEEHLPQGFKDLFINNIVKEWKERPTHFSRTTALQLLSDMGALNQEADNFLVEDLTKSDPLFRQYIYLTLPLHSDNPLLKAKNFIEKNCEIPLAFFEGGKDRGVNTIFICECFDRHIKKLQPHSVIHVFASAGHCVFKECSKEINPMMLQFLESVRSIPRKKLSQTH